MAGVDDAALLAPLSEEALEALLHARWRRGLVYTYVGEALVAVNPARPLPLYEPERARRYLSAPPHRLPPHVYGVAAEALRRVRDRGESQCVVVAGASGSGKTEAARLCVQAAAVSAAAALAPAAPARALAAAGTLLEAFGNAATATNHNASRFGQLLEIELDFTGAPVGGHITHYLLEKERASGPPRGERNFHVLYQLLAGADVALLKRLKLQRSWERYRVLTGEASEAGEASEESGREPPRAAHERDREHFAFTTGALDTLGLAADAPAVLRLLAFLLKAGNVRFEPQHAVDGSLGTRLLHAHELAEACALVGADADELAAALAAPPAADDAADDAADWARAALDRLLAALYSRLFTWLVRRVNRALQPPAGAAARGSLAVLDPHSLQALPANGLQRLLANYAAERVHAAALDALAREQRLYAREGLPWRWLPLREHEHAAHLLDELLPALAALAARAAPDGALLPALAARPHPRLRPHPPDHFTVLHFGGGVRYCARGMLAEERAATGGRAGRALGGAREPLLRELFGGDASPRRGGSPASGARALVSALLRRLPPAPRLVRCVLAGGGARWDAAAVRAQLRALHVPELARLRRAGWCDSLCARALLRRYGPLAAPAAPAPACPVEAARALLRRLPIPGGEFAFGRTRVFIRSPRAACELEALRAARVEALVRALQRAWRRHRARRRIAAAGVVARAWRAWRARRPRAEAARRLWRWWVAAARRRYVAGLWARLPPRHRSPVCGAWPALAAPRLLGAADALLRRLHHAWRCREYRARFDQTARNRMREKVTASALFRGRKASYAASVAHPFVGDYVRLRASAAWRRGAGAGADAYVVFAEVARRVARDGGGARVLVALSTAALLVLEARSLRVRRRVAAAAVRRLALSPFADDVVAVRAAEAPARCLGGRRRADLLLRTPHALELATKLFLVVQNAAGAPPHVLIAPEFDVEWGGAAGRVVFAAGAAGGADRLDVLL